MNVSQGNGSITVEQIEAPHYPYTFDFQASISVTIEAVPAFGYAFDSWSGDLSGSTNPVVLELDCNKSVTASFSRDNSLIGIAVSGLVVVGLLVTAIVMRRRRV